MLLDLITTENKLPEKLTLLFKCIFISVFLIILYLLSDKADDNVSAIPEKGSIQAPMKNTGSGSLQSAQQARASQRSTLFIAGSSN